MSTHGKISQVMGAVVDVAFEDAASHVRVALGCIEVVRATHLSKQQTE